MTRAYPRPRGDLPEGAVGAVRGPILLGPGPGRRPREMAGRRAGVGLRRTDLLADSADGSAGTQALVIGCAASALVGLVALVTLLTVVSCSNWTIRQKNAEIVRQFRQLEASNEKLLGARAEAEAEGDQAKEVTEFLVSSFRKPDPADEGEKVTVAQVLGRAIGSSKAATSRRPPAPRSATPSARPITAWDWSPRRWGSSRRSSTSGGASSARNTPKPSRP